MSENTKNQQQPAEREFKGVIDFYKKSLEDSLEEVARENKFNSVAHKLEITGYCKNCSKRYR